MSESVRINIQEDFLEVIVSDESQFLSGLHRVFLAKVLGLREKDNGFGYYLNKSKTNLSDTIVEIVEYFKEEGAEIIFDEESEKIVDAFDEGKDDFEQARLLGQKIKNNPPKSIEIPNFKRELKSYQIAPVAHLISVGNSANFSVQGSGKTTLTLAGYSIF